MDVPGRGTRALMLETEVVSNMSIPLSRSSPPSLQVRLLDTGYDRFLLELHMEPILLARAM